MQDGPCKHSTEHFQFRLHAVHFVLNISVLSVCGPNLRFGCLVSYAMFCLLIKAPSVPPLQTLLTLLSTSARAFFRNRSRAGLYGSTCTHGEITSFEDELQASLLQSGYYSDVSKSI